MCVYKIKYAFHDDKLKDWIRTWLIWPDYRMPRSADFYRCWNLINVHNNRYRHDVGFSLQIRTTIAWKCRVCTMLKLVIRHFAEIDAMYFSFRMRTAYGEKRESRRSRKFINIRERIWSSHTLFYNRHCATLSHWNTIKYLLLCVVRISKIGDEDVMLRRERLARVL